MRNLIASLLIASIATIGQAQYYEVGMAAGASNYAGELTNNGFRASEFHPALGIFARYNHNTRLAAVGSVTLAQISGSDATSGNAKTLSRNLNFRSPLYEISAMGEFNLMPYAPRNNQGSALYLTAGIAGFYFNPQTEFQGKWVDLQPLGTEGQGSKVTPEMEKYKRVQVAIPFGAGAKFSLGNRVNLGFEVLVRRTFTDYLDDISGTYPDIASLTNENPLAAELSFRTPQYMREAQPNPVGEMRGNADVKDYYMTIMMRVGFNLTHKQGLDFDKKYHIFKDPPPALGMNDAWWLYEPRA